MARPEERNGVGTALSQPSKHGHDHKIVGKHTQQQVFFSSTRSLGSAGGSQIAFGHAVDRFNLPALTVWFSMSRVREAMPHHAAIMCLSFKPRLQLGKGIWESVAVASKRRKAMAIKRSGHSSDPLREGREFWSLALVLQRESGLTMAAFCRREGLSDKAFSRWKRKLSLPPERTAEPAVFVPVSVTNSTAEDFSPTGRRSLPGGGDRRGVVRRGAWQSTGDSPAMVELYVHLANGRCVQARVPTAPLPLRCVLEALEGLS